MSEVSNNDGTTFIPPSILLDRSFKLRYTVPTQQISPLVRLVLHLLGHLEDGADVMGVVNTLGLQEGTKIHTFTV